MFCPICKYEYRPGFIKCKDCNVQLVNELPPESETVEYEELLSTYNPSDISLLKSLLDPEGIIYFFQGEQFSYVRPLADPVRLMVKKDQISKASEIIKDLDLSIVAYSHSDGENGSRMGQQSENVKDKKEKYIDIRFWIGLISGILIGITILFFLENKGYFSFRTSQTEWDSNNDGNIDVWREVKKDGTYIDIYDVNFDGKQDNNYYYNKEGALERSALDTNFDEKIDWLYFFNQQGLLERSEADIDFDGHIDYWIRYKDGYIVEDATDYNRDGEKDEWCTYQKSLKDECKWSYLNDDIIDKKIIYKNGKKIKELYDRNRDGTFDQTILLDEFERVIEDKKTD